MDCANELTPEKTRKCYRKRINYALAATLLASGESYDSVAEHVGAKSINVLKVGLHRLGLSRTTVLEPSQLANGFSQSLASKVANKASELLRDRLASTLDRHALALDQVPARVDLKHIRQVGEALEPLARSAKIVHDWGNETSQGIIAFGIVEQMDQAQDVIDLQETSPSVPDATTSSVPGTEPDSTTTLDHKPQ